MKTKEQTIPKWFKGMIYDEGEKVTNSFSGDSYELNGLELSIYDFIMGSQYVFEMAPKTVTQKQIAGIACVWSSYPPTRVTNFLKWGLTI